MRVHTPSFNQLLEDIEDPFFKKWPPSLFLKTMGLNKASTDFVLAAWSLFKQEKRRLSRIEILEFIKRQKDVDKVINNRTILVEDPKHP